MAESSYYPSIKTLIGDVFDGKKPLCHTRMFCNEQTKAFQPGYDNKIDCLCLNGTPPALQEAWSIELHLRPLSVHLFQLEKEEFPRVETLLPPLFHLLFLIWTRCPSYSYPTRMVVLQQELCNLLIQQVSENAWERQSRRFYPKRHTHTACSKCSRKLKRLKVHSSDNVTVLSAK